MRRKRKPASTAGRVDRGQGNKGTQAPTFPAAVDHIPGASPPTVPEKGLSGEGKGAGVGSARAVATRYLVLLGAWVVITVPAWALIVGWASVTSVLRMDLALITLAFIMLGAKILRWTPDAARLRECLLWGLVAQAAAGPVILAMDPSGVIWLSVLGSGAALHVYPQEWAPDQLAQLVILGCLWVAVRLIPSLGSAMAGLGASDLKSLEPFPLFWLAFVVTAALSLTIDLQSGIASWEPEDLAKTTDPIKSRRRATGCGLVAFLLATFLLAYVGFSLNLEPWRGFVAAVATGTGVFVGVLAGERVGGRIARSVALGTLRRVAALFSLAEYLADRTKLLGAFILGYGIVALWFAAAFQVLCRSHAGAFHGLTRESGFDEFLYLSVITLGTVGYGDIAPVTRDARLLVMLEVFCGIVWSTVVFAGVVWFAQADGRMARAGEKRADRSDRDPAPEAAGREIGSDVAERDSSTRLGSR